MAFGFGFNKQKVLSAAEKFVQQGKLQNAIAEYEKILKHDAKDLTVSNTVGDLYARQGDSDKAAECFKSVGDAYASQGFTVKAIAMYKKLSKIKASMECVLRLAELYTQQGLFNDARAQYLQVADDFLKSGQLDQAVKIFEKTLEMDPDNVAMRTKLAEVYIRLNKKPEAWKILSAAAETLRSKGQLAAADEILQRMLKLEPGNSYALMLRGKAALDAGDSKAAIDCLSKIGDLDSNPEAMRALFQAYLRARNFKEAGTVASKLATVHDDSTAITELADALMQSQMYREVLQTYEQHADRLLRTDPAKLIEALRSIIGHLKDDSEGLEIVLALHQKSGETTHITEIYELLAHAYVQNGDLEKARDYYLKLTQLEPANQMHARNYQQVLEKLGAAGDTPHLITAEEGAVLVDELEATAPFIEQRYDDEVALAVRAAMTDAELFISYNMPTKALGPLESSLPKAPQDLRLNQKLAALYTRGGKFTEAASCCRTLQSLYREAGHAEEASRYGDLATKYEERGGTPGKPQPVDAPAPTKAKAAAATAGAGTSTVHTSTPGKVVAPTAPAAEFEISAPSAIEEEIESASTPPANAAAVEVPPAAPKTAAPAAKGKSGLFFHAPTPGAPAAAPAPAAAVTAPAPVAVAPSAPVAASAAPEIVQQASAAQAAEFSVAIEQPQPGDADLSSEWEQDLTVEEPESAAPETTHQEFALQEARESNEAEVEEPVAHAIHAQQPAAPNLDEGMEEVRFYLGQGMTDQAEQALAKLEAVAPGSPELAVLRLGVDSARQTALAPPEMEIAAEDEPSVPEPTVIEPPAPPIHAQAARPAAPQPWPQQRPIASSNQPPVAEAARPVLDTLVSDLEDSLGEDFLATPAQSKTAAEPVADETPEETVAAESGPGQEFRSPGTLDDFVSDLEASLGNDSVPEPAIAPPVAASVSKPVRPVAASAPVHANTPAAAAVAHALAAKSDLHPPKTAAATAAGVDLSDMFGELKQELEEGGSSTDEDPETHYNLGVAFREMGLLDEAIGEFQKVCQTTERGHAFSQIMQTYTWLAQCFLDKGVPEAAVRWYERALKLPNLDAETRTALHYELAASLETAGDKPAALNNFLEVYGSNIEYRDVAERIKALRT